jgi:hypothetical protein
MPDWLYHTLRFLHPFGMFLAFAAAPIALGSTKGGRHHVLAGKVFAGGMVLGAVAGILMSLNHSPPAYSLLYFGLITLFYLATGYLAPRIGRGSCTDYRWDRAATALGAAGSVAMIWHGLLEFTPSALIGEGAVFGGIGFTIAASHARWRGPADPSRWRVEHLTSLLAAYQVVWAFIFGLYIRVLPRSAQVLIPAVVGVAAILWTRRRFGEARGTVPVKALA